MGALRPFFCVWVRSCAHFLFGGISVNRKVRYLTHAALIAALYAVLTHLQNLLFPGSANFAIQFRVSEAMCVLAFFTPAAIPGLTVGCALFNLTFSGAMPLDPVIGSLATLLAAWGMWATRGIRVKKLPLLGLALPAVSNALLVGWELTLYFGEAFWLNALYVAIGETVVLYTLGIALYTVLSRKNLAARLFS